MARRSRGFEVLAARVRSARLSLLAAESQALHSKKTVSPAGGQCEARGVRSAGSAWVGRVVGGAALHAKLLECPMRKEHKSNRKEWHEQLQGQHWLASQPPGPAQAPPVCSSVTSHCSRCQSGEVPLQLQPTVSACSAPSRGSCRRNTSSCPRSKSPACSSAEESLTTTGLALGQA